MSPEATPDRRCFLKAASTLVGAPCLRPTPRAPAAEKTAERGKQDQVAPVIVVHGGYTSQLPERPEALRPRRTCWP